MAELRYNINHSYRWQTGDCYTVIYYTTSYNATTNETTVTVSSTLMRLWGATNTNTTGTTTVTVTATDSGASGSVSASASDYWWNYGFIVVQPSPSPNKIVVKHSDTAGQKSVKISGHTGMSHWQWEYTEAAGSATVVTGSYTPPTYNLSINAGTGSTVTVNRTSSNYGATGYLSNGSTIYKGDVLQINFGASTGYNLASGTVNGTAFESGGSYTVSGNTSIVTTASVKSFTLTLNTGTGSTVNINRISSPKANAPTGEIGNNATIYYSDVLEISFGAEAGFKLKSSSVNGVAFVSGSQYTVTGNVIIITTAERSGLVYIDNGSKYKPYFIYIDNGGSWKKYIPYIDNGSAWKLYS